MAKIVREEGLDKFYTIPEVAQSCIDELTKRYGWNWDLVIEPSAGSGSFYNLLPHPKLGIDIAPESDDIIELDFFDYDPPAGRILVVGNPPFGRVSSLAVKFFQKAKFASIIAFIVPRTFRRISIQNRLPLQFHLVHDIDIAPNSFTPQLNVKCCFQIWEKRDELRMHIHLATTHPDFDFVPLGPVVDGRPTPPIADFALLAYGGACGRIEKNNLHTLSPKSWHWIKSNIDVDVLIQNFMMLDYSVSKNTARQNSIGKGELVQLYSAI